MATGIWSRILFILVVAVSVILFRKWPTLFDQQTTSQTSNRKWESNTLVDRNKYMYNNSFTSDIKFRFGNNQTGEIFYAHKYVLATSSPVFYEILYSTSSQPKKDVRDIYLPSSDNENVEDFFKFLYEEKCPTATNIQTGLKLLHLVVHYQVASFQTACKNFLKPTAQDAFKFLEQFLELKLERYISISFNFIDTLAHEYFTSEYFLNIKLSTLEALIQRDTLNYSEVKLFKAMINWVDHQCLQQNVEASFGNRRKILGNVMYKIRFLLMTLNEFTKDVIVVDILEDHESIAIIKAIAGHHVPDLKWNTPGLRRERKHAGGNWWAYFSGVLLVIVGGLGGLIVLSCESYKNQSENSEQMERKVIEECDATEFESDNSYMGRQYEASSFTERSKLSSKSKGRHAKKTPRGMATNYGYISWDN